MSEKIVEAATALLSQEYDEVLKFSYAPTTVLFGLNLRGGQYALSAPVVIGSMYNVEISDFYKAARASGEWLALKTRTCGCTAQVMHRCHTACQCSCECGCESPQECSDQYRDEFQVSANASQGVYLLTKRLFEARS